VALVAATMGEQPGQLVLRFGVAAPRHLAHVRHGLCAVSRGNGGPGFWRIGSQHR